MSENMENKAVLEETVEKNEEVEVRIISAETYLKKDGEVGVATGKIVTEINRDGNIIKAEPIEFPMYNGEKRNEYAFKALKLAKKIKLRNKDNFTKDNTDEMLELVEYIEKAQKGEEYVRTTGDKLLGLGTFLAGAALIGGVAVAVKNADAIGASLSKLFNKGDQDLKNQTSIEEVTTSNDGVTIEKNEKGEYVVSAPSLNGATSVEESSFPTFEEALPSEYNEKAYEGEKVEGNFRTEITYEDFIQDTYLISKEYDEKGYGIEAEDIRAFYYSINKDKMTQEDVAYLETTEVDNSGETYLDPTSDGKLRDLRDFNSNYIVRYQNAAAGTYDIDTVPDLTKFINDADTMKVYNKSMEAINVLADKNTTKEQADAYYDAIYAWSIGLPSDLLGDPRSLDAGARYDYNQIYGRGLLPGMIVGGKFYTQKEADQKYDAIMGTYVDENGVTQGNTEIRKTEDIKAFLEGACKAYRR